MVRKGSKKERTYYAYVPKEWWESYRKGDMEKASELMVKGDSMMEIKLRACHLSSEQGKDVEIWTDRGPIAETRHEGPEGACKIIPKKEKGK